MKYEVLIVGGGAAGLVLAIELGRRGVRCIVCEEDADPPAFPKANNSTARTMEHYRRLGFAEEIRQLGLPADLPPTSRTTPVSAATRSPGCTGRAAARRWSAGTMKTRAGPRPSRCTAGSRCSSSRC